MHRMHPCNYTHGRLRGYGEFNALNALAAVATAGYFRLDLKALSASWCALPAPEGRFRLEEWTDRDVLVVDDSYNANPLSFNESLRSFLELARERRKVVVAGDMLELGKHAALYHEALGQLLSELKIDLVIGVGPLSWRTIRSFLQHRPSGEAHHADQHGRVIGLLQKYTKEGDAVLIKGSHALDLQKIKHSFVAFLKETPVS